MRRKARDAATVIAAEESSCRGRPGFNHRGAKRALVGRHHQDEADEDSGAGATIGGAAAGVASGGD